MAAVAVRDRLRTLTGLFDDDELEAGMAMISQDERDRLVACLRRASDAA